MYERKVVYLFQYHGNTVGKNIGYIKWNRSQEEGKLILNIKGLHLTKDTVGECSILLEKKKFWLGKVYLKNAVAEGKYFIDSELCKKMEEKNITPDGVLIEFGDVRCVAAFSSNALNLDEYLYDKKTDDFIKAQVDSVNVPKGGVENEDTHKEDTEKKLEAVEQTPLPPEKELIRMEEPVGKIEYPKPENERIASQEEPDNEDIFTKLKKLFPSVHPFEKVENKEYLSITPREIEFFKKEYITLVNNSFLLHGYQNYKYLILGRDLDLEIYTIGVPGVYYEKEEMMAKMFGFEKFLPALNGEATQGSFGYYTKVLG